MITTSREYHLFDKIKSFRPFLKMLGFEIHIKNRECTLVFQKEIKCVPKKIGEKYIYDVIQYQIPDKNFTVCLGVNESDGRAIFLGTEEKMIAIYQDNDCMMVDITKDGERNHFAFHPSYIRFVAGYTTGGKLFSTYMFGKDEFSYCGEHLFFEKIVPQNGNESLQVLLKRSFSSPSKIDIITKSFPFQGTVINTIDQDAYPAFVSKQLSSDPLLAKKFALLQETLPEFLPKIKEQFPCVEHFFKQDGMKFSFKKRK